MGSAIDATKPVDSAGASKSDLRSNLSTAKTELNHGGFFTQLGTTGVTTGQLERRTRDRLNDLPISVKDYGAVGDGTSRPVSQWFTGGARDRGYANLAALQAVYPHVTSASDEIDWAAIQMACFVASQFGGLECRRVYIPGGRYPVNATIKLDRNIELQGAGMSSVWIIATAALTSGPCLQIKPTPTATTSFNCGIFDLAYDATLVPITNLTNHGIEFFNTLQAEVRRVNIVNVRGCGILMANAVYFCTVDSVKIYQPQDTAICLRNGIVNGADGYGDGGETANGNHFSNIFFFLNFAAPVRRARLIEIFSPCSNNFFTDMQVQTGVYRLDDCFIYQGGSGNIIRNLSLYDGPGVTRTCTTSSGTSSKVRLTFGYMSNLVTGDRLTATGITGVTPGTLYTVTAISEFVFDLTGTTYSGSPQTGRITRGGNITATAAGGENRIQCTAAEHGLWTGQQITVTGLTGGTGTQVAVRIDRNTFQLAETTFGGSSQAGTWVIDRPTSLIQFGDPGVLSGSPCGFRNTTENMIGMVMNHDASTDVYGALFTGIAIYNTCDRMIPDQAGSAKPYLVENGNTTNYMFDWSTPTLPGGTSRLDRFMGYGIDYSARLGAKDFGTTAPVVGDLVDGQIAFAVISGVGKMYWRKGSTLFTFTGA